MLVPAHALHASAPRSTEHGAAALAVLTCMHTAAFTPQNHASTRTKQRDEGVTQTTARTTARKARARQRIPWQDGSLAERASHGQSTSW